MNDPEIVCYLAIDKPNNCTQYGGVVVAPLVGEIMKQSLTYLGIERDYENQIEQICHEINTDTLYKKNCTNCERCEFNGYCR